MVVKMFQDITAVAVLVVRDLDAEDLLEVVVLEAEEEEDHKKEFKLQKN